VTTLRKTTGRRAAALPLLLVLAVLALVVAGCGSGGGSEPTGAPKGTPTSAVTEIAPGTLVAGDEVSAPAEDDVVLTLTGVGTTNADGELRLSIAQLESMRTVEATLYEPFLKRDVTFRGVLLEDLLAIAAPPEGWEAIDSVAYNEYAVTLPSSITRHQGALLATRADGQLIPIDKGGPSRIVFTEDHPDVKNESLWIWSTRSMAFR
jgi:hypothetical protein